MDSFDGGLAVNGGEFGSSGLETPLEVLLPEEVGGNKPDWWSSVASQSSMTNG